MSNAIRIRPMVASEKTSTVVGKLSTRAKPSVSKDEPLILKATYQDCASIAQSIAMYPRLIENNQTTSRAMRATGAYNSMTLSRSR